MNFFQQVLSSLKKSLTPVRKPQRRGITLPAKLEPLEMRVMLVPNFTDVGTRGITGVDHSAVASGDFDNDGDQDLLVAGDSAGGKVTTVYQNDGSGNFTNINAGLTGVNNAAVAWGDYDNDGKLDIVVTGNSNSGPIAKVYHNDGNGVFSDINAGLTGVTYSSAAWGDYDNDGKLDLLIAGAEQGGTKSTRIYRNSGNGTFTDVNAGLTGISVGAAAWGDYDSDGHLDIAMIGRDSGMNTLSKVYHNNGSGVFSDINAGLSATSYGTIAWGDYDNDGDLDLAYSGYAGSGTSLFSAQAKIYRNDGNNTFTDIGASLTGATFGNVAWGDYNNDGKLDLLINGYNGLGTAKAYRNDGSNTFTDANAGLTGEVRGSSIWDDFDNDGDLDLVTTGQNSGFLAKVYRNETPTANTAPAAPTGLTIIGSGPSNLSFSWTAATDSQTPSEGLSYNLRVGTTPGGSDVFSSMANSSTGIRTVERAGQIQRTNFTLTGLTPGVNYYWSVQAVDPSFDASPFAAEQLAFINVAPVVTPQDFLIGENSSNGAFIGTIAASDVNPGQTKTYAITAGNTNNAFAINSSTGALTVNNSAALNYESIQQFNLTVRVTDNGTPALSGTAAVRVYLRDVNEAPVVTPTQFLIGENSANNAYIGVVPVSDVDAGQTQTYSIVAGNTGNAFAINPTTGVLTVNNSAMLDYETTQRFDLVVRTVDSGNPALAGSATVTIFLRDTNDAPVVQATQFLIGENSANGAYIGNVPATDQDAGQTKTYSIVAGNTGNAFAINPTTGVLTVNNSAMLDYETVQRFDLTIRVADNGSPAAAGFAVTTVFLRNENDAPVMISQDFLINENTVNSGFLGTMTAYDQDAGQTKTFSITGGNTDNAFAINPTTGALTVNNSAALNFETTPQFHLTITVTDNGNPAKSGSTSITVYLRDVNETPVVVAQDFLIAENTPNNAFIGTMVANDPDAGQTKTFTITGGNTNNAFSIEPSTGILRVNNSAMLDYETTPQFHLTITATDNGNPALSSSAPVTVYLRDVVGARPAHIAAEDTTTVIVPTIRKTTANSLARSANKPK